MLQFPEYLARLRSTSGHLLALQFQVGDLMLVYNFINDAFSSIYSKPSSSDLELDIAHFAHLCRLGLCPTDEGLCDTGTHTPEHLLQTCPTLDVLTQDLPHP